MDLTPLRPLAVPDALESAPVDVSQAPIAAHVGGYEIVPLFVPVLPGSPTKIFDDQHLALGTSRRSTGGGGH
jgi:hypothetical protein